MPTLKDVAKKAGVAPSTVSRVINNSSRISEETKEKVRKIMDEIGYHPNINARNLVKQRSHNLGLVIPYSTEEAFADPFYSEILRGIGVLAHSKGFNLLLLTSSGEEEEKKTVLNAVRGKQIDGVLLLRAKKEDQLIEELTKLNFPFVIVGRPEEKDKYYWVNNDNIAASERVVDYLIKNGHRNIAMIVGDKNYIMNDDRLQGYKNSFQKNNLNINEDLIVQSEMIDYQSIYMLSQKMIKEHPEITAFYGMSDTMAYTIMQAMNDLQVKIPEDISIVGFNNNPVSKLISPPLTTVDINIYLLGNKATELLIGVINGQIKKYEHTIVPANIIERDSCRNLN
ncbi:LacI family transcriptional regulator [Halanaerobium saccharolyticum]|jgi:DNA-binding LacI/PurR family transcriptional regulator|uniref:LacI family transcriptional regulator n=1 Tax=Halanaerobium saccharolyticum TaxID=43595 RepID=A0A4R7YU99_9FIRM|nr:LacI family DNA-binding transcriptional regulator [Halanaerobium saccharolyticum]RAK05246.1 LacI family transcriptional regulator [Halanaerobium saccharolyticum]TDV99611.1 LacI family transcriptional regulator [Halanaerobium saccharolyticum]TDX51727.1 LacI family transcriptional regulator [Halanaerobium saccharolyticum]